MSTKQQTLKTSGKNFTMLVLGQIVTILGSSLLRFVLSLHILDITGRADIFSIIYAISSVPLLFSPVAGAIADRVNKRNLMVGIDFVNGLIVLGLVFLFNAGVSSVFVIAIIMVLLGITSAMESPTVMACIPLIAPIEDLEKANGIISGTNSLAQILAPIMGGILYGFFKLNTLIVISCVAFFLASFMELFIRVPFAKRPHDKHIVPSIIKDLKDGFVYVAKQPIIRNCIVLAALLNLVLSPYFIVGIPFVLRIAMNSSDTMYGVGLGLTEFGMVLGALGVGVFSSKIKMKSIHRIFMIIAALLLLVSVALLPSILGLGAYPSFVILFAGVVPILMLLTVVSIYIMTHIQRETPNELLGKIMAIVIAVSQCAAPIGQIIYGLLFEKFSSTLYLLTIALSLVTLLVAFLAKRLTQKEIRVNEQNCISK